MNVTVEKLCKAIISFDTRGIVTPGIIREMSNREVAQELYQRMVRQGCTNIEFAEILLNNRNMLYNVIYNNTFYRSIEEVKTNILYRGL